VIFADYNWSGVVRAAKCTRGHAAWILRLSDASFIPVERFETSAETSEAT